MIKNKICKKCEMMKTAEEFYFYIKAADRLQKWCKSCQSDYYIKNREKTIARVKAWSEDKKDHKREYDKRRRHSQGDYIRQYDMERSRLPHRRALTREITAKRKMMLKQASPAWVSEDQKRMMKLIYRAATALSALMGTPYHVDHDIPIKGKNVCGLHVLANLRILKAVDNIKKSNRVTIGAKP